jgi:hypothetical protein
MVQLGIVIPVRVGAVFGTYGLTTTEPVNNSLTTLPVLLACTSLISYE